MAASSNGSSSTSLLSRQGGCFADWLKLQEQDLSELLQLQSQSQSQQNVIENYADDQEVLFKRLIQKNLDHFKEYAEQRAQLASEHVSPYFAPTWCSYLEASLLWLGGCRPSIFIRLLYAITGLHTEVYIRELLEGAHVDGDLDRLAISGPQLNMIDGLHRKTIDDEERLSSELTSLQEAMADYPFAAIAKELNLNSSVGAGEVAASEALKLHDKSMGIMLHEADKLRFKTLKEILDILNPTQGIDFLICSKKLHICIHRWGKKQDRMHG